jgi:chorismate mutase
LEEYRAQIDGVDQQIVELLNKRAAIVQRIGTVKKEAGLAVAAPAREQQVLDHVVEVGKTGPLPPATVRRIYEVILWEMRAWEAIENANK